MTIRRLLNPRNFARSSIAQHRCSVFYSTVMRNHCPSVSQMCLKNLPSFNMRFRVESEAVYYFHSCSLRHYQFSTKNSTVLYSFPGVSHAGRCVHGRRDLGCNAIYLWRPCSYFSSFIFGGSERLPRAWAEDEGLSVVAG